MNLLLVACQLLIFPGVAYVTTAGFLMEWIQRKTAARLQGRIGPPFYQPFYDTVKLFGKRPIPRPPLQGFFMTALPLAAAVATLGAAALLPVWPSGLGFPGDVILLVALIEVGPLLAVVGGYASRSLWGALGGAREGVMVAAYNLPFLTALVALAWNTDLSLGALASTASWPVRVAALAAILVCLPAKLHLNPFSIASAEQEVYAGITTEYDGPRLALWEVAHAAEWVALTGLFAVLCLPISQVGVVWGIPLFVVGSFAVVLVLSVLAAATARFKIAQTARWFWLWGLLLASSALGLALAGI